MVAARKAHNRCQGTRRGTLHKGWLWQEEEDLQLWVAWWASVATRKAHSQCQGAKGCDGGFTLQGVGWRLKMGETSKRHWKKKMEPSGSKGIDKFVQFTSRTTGSTGPIPVQPLSEPIDRTGPKPWPADCWTSWSGRSGLVFKTMFSSIFLYANHSKFFSHWLI